MYQLVYKLLGSGAEGPIDALLCAEEIGDTGEVGALDIFEEPGRAGPAVDLGDFEVGGDGGFDADEFAFAL